MGLVRHNRAGACLLTLINCTQGKTLQMLALIMQSDSNKPTLVVAPLSALHVWKREIDARLELPISDVCLFYGNERTTPASMLRKFRIILTNYETIM